jgi:hypothetical protein
MTCIIHICRNIYYHINTLLHERHDSQILALGLSNIGNYRAHTTPPMLSLFTRPLPCESVFDVIILRVRVIHPIRSRLDTLAVGAQQFVDNL